jgi:hypothetical protein
MLRDAAQRARIEKVERNEWRCDAPQHEAFETLGAHPSRLARKRASASG